MRPDFYLSYGLSNSLSAFSTACFRVSPVKNGALRYLPDFLSSTNAPTAIPSKNTAALRKAPP